VASQSAQRFGQVSTVRHMDRKWENVKKPALRTLWRQDSIFRHCGPPTGIDYFSLVAGGVSARFMVANTLNRAASESAVRLSSPSSIWFAWRAAASASSSIWSAVKNTAVFLLRLPDVISARPSFSRTNRGVRAATGSLQPGFDGPDRSYCSGSSIAPAQDAKALSAVPRWHPRIAGIAGLIERAMVVGPFDRASHLPEVGYF